jgi:1-pyrroline-5-carboxylate dehydrogenase
VINMVPGAGAAVGDPVLDSPDLAGIHFTGSTSVFKNMWARIGQNIERYKYYPRIVGETGGKDFVFAHPSADVPALVTALIRGAFEFQGQKCSAASRAYIPQSLWPRVERRLVRDLGRIKVGDPRDFTNFMGAVIDRRAYRSIKGYIDHARRSRDASFVYRDRDLDRALELCDSGSAYALTGAVFARDRAVIGRMTDALTHAAGNFYINDKPTGAVVGQQPFGGGRASGTNDKAGSVLNLVRWVSPRAIKETFVPPTDFRYPFLQPD